MSDYGLPFHNPVREGLPTIRELTMVMKRCAAGRLADIAFLRNYCRLCRVLVC
jgi:hypothetical protein